VRGCGNGRCLQRSSKGTARIPSIITVFIGWDRSMQNSLGGRGKVSKACVGRDTDSNGFVGSSGREMQYTIILPAGAESMVHGYLPFP
jgi:hypothetical protein